MGQALALQTLIATRQVWQGSGERAPGQGVPTGFAALDAALPFGGWPRAALTEVLLTADGTGEIALLMPTLSRLTRADQRVALIAPPYIPYAPAWRAGGVRLSQLEIVQAEPTQALWAFEQCLRSGGCAAVLGWPVKADHHALRRLQVAAGAGQALGFVLRDHRHARQASPAALRLEIRSDRQIHVLKCRGGHPPARAFVLTQ